MKFVGRGYCGTRRSASELSFWM